MQSTTGNPMYALRDVPGKGKGLVAIEKISKGTRILSEEPIITVQKNWNENIKRHTVHALRDIYKGEEITIYYLGVHKNYEARHEALQAKFGFTCFCRLYSLPPEQSQESDRRLDEIYRLDSLIGRGGIEGILSSPLRTLHYVDQQVRLYNEQGPDDAGLPRAFLDAAQIAIANGDLARGRIFVERAVSAWWTALGGDSTEAIEHGTLARDPLNAARVVERSSGCLSGNMCFTYSL